MGGEGRSGRGGGGRQAGASTEAQGSRSSRQGSTLGTTREQERERLHQAAVERAASRKQAKAVAGVPADVSQWRDAAAAATSAADVAEQQAPPRAPSPPAQPSQPSPSQPVGRRPQGAKGPGLLQLSPGGATPLLELVQGGGGAEDVRAELVGWQAAGDDGEMARVYAGMPDLAGVTALLAAAQAGAGDVIGVLLEFGAAPNRLGGEDGWSALHHAGQAAGQAAVVAAAALVAGGADLECRTNSGGAEGLTPLMAAAQLGHVELIRWLLDHGAAVNAVDSQGKTALHHAAVSGARWPGVGADPEAGSHDASRNVALVEVLVAAGADVDATDRAGMTPTAKAYRCGVICTALSLPRGAVLGVCGAQRWRAASSLDLFDLFLLLIRDGAGCRRPSGPSMGWPGWRPSCGSASAGRRSSCVD